MIIPEVHESQEDAGFQTRKSKRRKKELLTFVYTTQSLHLYTILEMLHDYYEQENITSDPIFTFNHLKLTHAKGQMKWCHDNLQNTGCIQMVPFLPL